MRTDAAGLFKFPGFVIADQLAKGRFVQFCEHVTQFCMVGTAGRETEAISFPESSDEGIAALAANLPVLLAVSHNCHCNPSLRLRSACGAKLFANRSNRVANAFDCARQFVFGHAKMPRPIFHMILTLNNDFAAVRTDFTDHCFA
jgi:hypothetical protein